MDSYLSGRGFDTNRGDEDYSSEFKSLGSLMDLAKKTMSPKIPLSLMSPKLPLKSSTKRKMLLVLKVVSMDGVPSEIIISMVDGKILRIACDY
jgi:hypothetical protein